jgi:hypothetical protein
MSKSTYGIDTPYPYPVSEKNSQASEIRQKKTAGTGQISEKNPDRGKKSQGKSLPLSKFFLGKMFSKISQKKVVLEIFWKKSY